MRALAAMALGAGIVAVAAGCSIFHQDSIIAISEFPSDVCMNTAVGEDEVITGTPFAVHASNTDPVALGVVTLVNPVNIELVEVYIKRDAAFEGGTLYPDQLDDTFEPALGAMLPADEGDFTIAVRVRTTDPSAVSTFDGVRLTYTDDDASEFSVDGAAEFSFRPSC